MRVVGGLLILMISTGIAAGCGGSQSESTDITTPVPRAADGLIRTSKPLHAKHLYVGVSCGSPNKLDCDGIALSVEVPSEPDFVEATVDGYRTKLTRLANGKNADAFYQGRIQKPGLLHVSPLSVTPEATGKWIGKDPVRFPMSLRAVYRGKGVYTEHSFEQVRLYPGFG